MARGTLIKPSGKTLDLESDQPEFELWLCNVFIQGKTLDKLLNHSELVPFHGKQRNDNDYFTGLL